MRDARDERRLKEDFGLLGGLSKSQTKSLFVLLDSSDDDWSLESDRYPISNARALFARSFIDRSRKGVLFARRSCKVCDA